MPIVIMITHGETVSPDGYLTAASCLDALKKANLALGSLPENKRFPRPTIICGLDNETRRTAALIASDIHAKFERSHEALSENPGLEARRLLAKEIAASTEQTILISHQESIRLFVPELAAAAGFGLDTAIRDLDHNEIMVFNTETGRLTYAKTSPRLAVIAKE